MRKLLPISKAVTIESLFQSLTSFEETLLPHLRYNIRKKTGYSLKLKTTPTQKNCLLHLKQQGSKITPETMLLAYYHVLIKTILSELPKEFQINLKKAFSLVAALADSIHTHAYCVLHACNALVPYQRDYFTSIIPLLTLPPSEKPPLVHNAFCGENFELRPFLEAFAKANGMSPDAVRITSTDKLKPAPENRPLSFPNKHAQFYQVDLSTKEGLSTAGVTRCDLVIGLHPEFDTDASGHSDSISRVLQNLVPTAPRVIFTTYERAEAKRVKTALSSF